MYDWLYSIAPFAPFIIFFAATLDIFFVTGLILYGAAMMSMVVMMHTTDMISAPMIVLAAYLGTLTGNTANFFVGRLFSEVSFVAKRLTHSRVQTGRAFLRTRGLFAFILVCRFITFTRPLYALTLGTIDIRYRRFIIYEAGIALFWVVFWLCIILQGETLYYWLTN